MVDSAVSYNAFLPFFSLGITGITLDLRSKAKVLGIKPGKS
jgi:hypothetical protein